LARRIPLELPILTSFARTTTTPARRAHIVDTLAASAHPLLWLTLAITWPQAVIGEERNLAMAAQVNGDVREWQEYQAREAVTLAP
jgi:hypothetical protein